MDPGVIAMLMIIEMQERTIPTSHIVNTYNHLLLMN